MGPRVPFVSNSFGAISPNKVVAVQRHTMYQIKPKLAKLSKELEQNELPE